MITRILRAAAGAAVTAGGLGGLLAGAGWRPEGLWVAVVVGAVLLPLATGLGVALALGVGWPVPAWDQAARLAALASPVLGLFCLFSIMSVLSTRAPGAQQVAALVAGAATSAALAARFTGPDADPDAASDPDPGT